MSGDARESLLRRYWAYRPVGTGYRSMRERVRDGWALIDHFGARLTAPEPPEPLPTDSRDPGERYRVAAAIHGIDEEERREKLRQTDTQFGLRMLVAGLMLAWVMVADDFGALPELPVPGLATASMVAPILMVLLMAARMSLANRQLRERRLITFLDWLREPSQWLTSGGDAAGDDGSGGGPPAGNPPTGRTRRPQARAGRSPGAPGQARTAVARSPRWVTALLFAVGFCWTLAPVWAAAQIVVGGSPAPAPAGGSPLSFLTGELAASDLSRMWIERLFPNFLGGGVNAVGSAIMTLNSTLLLVATLMMSWHVLAGMVATAHEGKLLGQKWHQIWAPVRVTVGVGMLAPVAQGFNGAQWIVAKVFIWGFMLANAVWGGFVDTMASPDRAGGYGMISGPPAVTHHEVLKQVLEHELCSATIRAMPKLGEDRPWYNPIGWFSATPSAPLPDPTGAEVGSWRVWDWGPVCGSLKILAKDSNPALNNYYKATSGAVAVMVGQVRATFPLEQIGKGMQPGSGVAVPSRDQIARAATGLVEYARKDFPDVVAQAASDYATAIDGKGREAFKRDAEKFGWASAGTFAATMSRMSAMVADKAHISLEGSAMRLDDLSDANRKRVQEALGGFHRMWGDLVGDQMGIRSEAVSAGVDPDTQGFVTKFFSTVFAPFTTDLQKQLDRFTVNEAAPMASMMGFGHAILNGFWGLLVAITAVYAASKAAGKNIVTGQILPQGSAAEGAAEFLAPIALTILGGIFVCGAVHAYLLPALQFVMWTFAMAGIITFFVEAVVAASIWAFCHVRFDGDSFVGQEQRSGYIILFNAFFRPVLSLMGLILGMLTLSAISGLLNVTFGAAAAAQQAGQFTIVVGLLCYLGIITYLHYHLTVRSFSLIHMLPDRVARWMGASAEGLQEEQDTHSSRVLIAGMVKETSGQTFGAGVAAVNGMSKRGGQQARGQETQQDAAAGQQTRQASGMNVQRGGQTQSSDDPR